MKILKPNYRYIPVYQLITLSGLAAAIFIPDSINTLLSQHSIWLLLSFAVLLLPSAATPISPLPTMSVIKWLLAIFGICFSASCLFIGICQQYWFLTAPGDSQAITDSLQQLFSLNWALFPWPLCGMGAAILGIYYDHHNDRHLTGCLSILSEKFFSHPQFANGAELGIAFAATMSICICIALYSVNYAKMILAHYHLTLHQYLTPPSLMIILALSLIPTSQLFRKIFRYFADKPLGSGLYYGIFIIIFTLFLVTSNIVIHYFDKLQPAIAKPTLILTNYIKNFHHKTLYRLFYHCWLITWCPFAITLIAKISRGKSTRIIIATLLLINAILSTFWSSLLHAQLLTQQVIQWLSLAGLLIFFISLIAIKPNTEKLYHFISPPLTKRMRQRISMDKVFLVSIGMIATLLLFNHYLLSYLLFYAVIPTLLILILMSLSLCYFLYKKM